MTPTDATPAAPAPKPRLALAIATSLGLGYLPVAPGTWGSLAGIAIYAGGLFYAQHAHAAELTVAFGQNLVGASQTSWTVLPVTLVLALVGVWAAHRAAAHAGIKDPQFVVI